MLEAVHGGGESDTNVETEDVDASSTQSQPASDADAQATESAESLPLDVTFEILKNRRRRLVLEYLRDTGESTTIGELAEHIAAIENDTTVQQLNAQQRKRVYIGLYQCHLPKMDDADVVDFNQDRGLIAVGKNVEPLYEYLDVDETETEQPFNTAHAGGFIAFTSLFFVAQLSSAYTAATTIVVVFLMAVLAVSYRARTA